jgi:hypothetical protein
MGSVYRRGLVYWLKYRVQDRIIRESSDTDNLQAARRLLHLREGAAAEGRPIIPRAEGITVDQLLDAVLADYQANGQRLDRLMISFKHLRPALGARRAVHVKPADVTAYTVARQDQGAANASINNELAALKRAYNLAIRGERLYRKPYIAMLKTNNVRKGFFEEAQFEAVRRHLPEELRALMTRRLYHGLAPGQ